MLCLMGYLRSGIALAVTVGAGGKLKIEIGDEVKLMELVIDTSRVSRRIDESNDMK